MQVGGKAGIMEDGGVISTYRLPGRLKILLNCGFLVGFLEALG